MGRRWQLATVVVVLLAATLAGGGYLLTRARTSAPRHRPTVVASPPVALPALRAAAVPTPSVLRTLLRRQTSAAALGASLSGLVVDARTGQVLFARGADVPIPPASTVKLLTALAALDALGPGATLPTRVAVSGRTLYLVGGGDMTLASRARRGYPRAASVDLLARRTAAAVVGRGPFRLRYDAGAWPSFTLPPGWNTGYLSAGDVSRLSPLEVDEARLRPNQTQRFGDPAAAAASAFARALARAGVVVRGRSSAAVLPAAVRPVATVQSPPVAALVQRLLTVSDNDLAESLGRAVAVHDGLPPTSAGAATAVSRYVASLGLPTAGLHLYDASGLSRLDRVTARLLVAAVRLAQQRPAMRAVILGLPIAGATGTLAQRYRRGATATGAGGSRVKTGTLAGVSAVAGQVVDADGRLLDLAFVTDTAGLPTAAEQALDRLVATVASCGC
ncbi:MAG: D-alanyl-D-alanine carboxypeptidase/D-alanyl-D-alanine-endopeptidase [Frankiales bacterium]|nr:D-alanyl-D-alanine carboxypeptidase/D-alanyl-D-alanine-endopeptidase [Frankiales bacterium]